MFKGRESSAGSPASRQMNFSQQKEAYELLRSQKLVKSNLDLRKQCDSSLRRIEYDQVSVAAEMRYARELVLKRKAVLDKQKEKTNKREQIWRMMKGSDTCASDETMTDKMGSHPEGLKTAVAATQTVQAATLPCIVTDTTSDCILQYASVIEKVLDTNDDHSNQTVRDHQPTSSETLDNSSLDVSELLPARAKTSLGIYPARGEAASRIPPTTWIQKRCKSVCVHTKAKWQPPLKETEISFPMSFVKPRSKSLSLLSRQIRAEKKLSAESPGECVGCLRTKWLTSDAFQKGEVMRLGEDGRFLQRRIDHFYDKYDFQLSYEKP